MSKLVTPGVIEILYKRSLKGDLTGFGNSAMFQSICEHVQDLEAQFQAANERAELYKKAFVEVCRQFNYGDEKDYEAMRDSVLDLVRKDDKSAL